MKPINILLLLVSIAFASCRSQRITESTSVVADSSAHQLKTGELSESKKVNTASTSTDRSIEIDSTAEKIVITEYSKPDSAGKQHVDKVTTIERNQGKKRQNNITTELSNNADISRSGSIKETNDIEASKVTTTETKTVQKNRPATWKWVVYLSLSIGFLVIIYMVLKRFKIVR